MAGLIGLDSTSSGFDPGLQDPPITFGVWGDSGDADGVIGSSNTGVGVLGRSVDAAASAVQGSSQKGTGVDATSASGTALHARRDPGGGAVVTEAFLATPGLAADFRGDVATSGALRVGGRLDAVGVTGSSDTGVGVLGRSVDAAATAVQGSSQKGTGVDATSASGTALHARRDPGGGAAVTEAFLATPSLAADFRGDVATSGTLRVGGRLGIGIGAQTGPAAKLHVNGAEEGIRVQGPATGNANVAYVSFVDSAGTRIGYVGDGSTGDANVFLTSDLGDVVLNTAAGRILTATSSGNVGIGTGTPSAKLNIDPKGSGGIVVGDPDTGRGGSTSLLMDISDARNGFGRIQAIKSSGSAWGDIALNPLGGNVGIGTTAPRARLDVNGYIRAANIGLTNADCAEDFDVCETEKVEPGTVMVVGEEGVLYPSQQAYDKRVAGVISGAGDYQPGIVLDTQQSSSTRKPIALSGKVYCKVNAQYGAIEVGDLLTTSPTPGHAMRADDPLKAFGTVIGKALRSLKEGQGLIPILIALQ